MILPLGILGSGKGSNYTALVHALQRDAIPAAVHLVASDNPHAGILDSARAFGHPTHICPPSRFKTKLEPEIESALARALHNAGVQLLVLAGFMRVVKTPLLDAFPGRILNIHPSLLPAFKGLEAWTQALHAGVPETGCSVHWVDSSLDGGPVIDQERVPVLPGDTPASLHARIQEAEHRLLPAVIARIARGDIPLPGGTHA